MTKKRQRLVLPMKRKIVPLECENGTAYVDISAVDSVTPAFFSRGHQESRIVFLCDHQHKLFVLNSAANRETLWMFISPDEHSLDVGLVSHDAFVELCAAKAPSKAAYRGIVRRDPCAYCGNPGADVDHIHPTSRGGPDEWQNWTGSCQHCNRSKGARPLVFASSSGE